MSDHGYIKLFRCMNKKPIWQNSTPEQKTVLITLLLMVNHDEAEWEWKGQKFKVNPGQKVTSLEKIAEEAGKGISIQNVRSSLKRFEKLGFLTNESTKSGRLITIVNWELYQYELLPPNKEDNKEPTKNQQRTNKGATTNKNNKKDNNDKKSIYSENDLLNQSILDFIEMRKTIKKPISEKGISIVLGKLKKISSDENIQIEILNQSIMNSWQGVFPLRDINPKDIVKKTQNEFDFGGL